MAHVRPAVERWVTWSGLIPLPAFLALHLAHELSWAFATEVSEVVRPAPTAFIRLTSFFLVWLPLAVHVALGCGRWVMGHAASAAPTGDVPAASRLVSRVTSLLSLAFLAYHGRTYSLTVWRGEAAAEDAGFRLLEELSSATSGVPLSGGLYLLGLLVTAAHAGLGVHRGLLLEGLLPTPGKRRLSARACALGSAISFCLGAAAVIRVASGVLLR
ncbi:MAG: hypothetical protein EOO73_09250 [Myxococcales bacterium]|nr:MAG: hypothetical protein EOO73_09250 [Myxococcales bacterium]